MKSKRKKEKSGAKDSVPLVPETNEVKTIRLKWEFNGDFRPKFADAPEPHQESVWDFPRPPLIEAVQHDLQVSYQGSVLAKTTKGVRIIETAGAPTYYFPPDDVKTGLLSLGSMGSLCEWKGFSQPLFLDGKEIGWRYVRMFPQYKALYMWPSFYPAEVDCFIDAEQVSPQVGGYYGGWVTSNLAGPIKGEPGTQGW